MISIVITLQPAYVLQHRKYRETSLILDLLTRDFGVISVLAKGVRKVKSKTVALLRPFQALLISCSGKTEGVLLLTQVESLGGYATLTGLALYCGFYLNELILRFVAKFDPYPEIYQEYQNSLSAMENGADEDVMGSDTLIPNTTARIESILRLFEINLMRHLGFELQTACDFNSNQPIRADAKYIFYPDQGAVEHPQGNVTGRTLLALASKNLTERAVLFEAKQLMRTVIDFHLQGKPLKSRAALSQIYQQL